MRGHLPPYLSTQQCYWLIAEDGDAIGRGKMASWRIGIMETEVCRIGNILNRQKILPAIINIIENIKTPTICSSHSLTKLYYPTPTAYSFIYLKYPAAMLMGTLSKRGVCVYLSLSPNSNWL